MPCRSDYMEQNDFERRVQETAILLKWLLNAIGEEPIHDVNAIAVKQYPKKEHGDFVVALLCSKIRSFKEDQMNKFIYNGRVKESRGLAEWWEEHEAEDNKRVRKEAQQIQDEYDTQQALKKLTDRDKKLLGIKI